MKKFFSSQHGKKHNKKSKRYYSRKTQRQTKPCCKTTDNKYQAFYTKNTYNCTDNIYIIKNSTMVFLEQSFK